MCVHGLGHCLQPECQGAANYNRLRTDYSLKEIEPVQGGPIGPALACFGGVVRPLEEADLGLRPVDESRRRQLGHQAPSHLLHVRQPALDDARLFRFGERVNGKGLEAPYARFDMSTADHEK